MNKSREEERRDSNIKLAIQTTFIAGLVGAYGVVTVYNEGEESSRKSRTIAVESSEGVVGLIKSGYPVESGALDLQADFQKALDNLAPNGFAPFVVEVRTRPASVPASPQP